MNNESQQEIIEALKKILELYDIDIGDALEKEADSSSTLGLDYSVLIQKTQEKINDLQQQSDAILKKTGMTADQMDSYTSNPNNFSKEQWEALQHVKIACNKYKKETETLLSSLEKKLPTQELDNSVNLKVTQKKKTKKKTWFPL